LLGATSRYYVRLAPSARGIRSASAPFDSDLSRALVAGEQRLAAARAELTTADGAACLRVANLELRCAWLLARCTYEREKLDAAYGAEPWRLQVALCEGSLLPVGQPEDIRRIGPAGKRRRWPSRTQSARRNGSGPSRHTRARFIGRSWLSPQRKSLRTLGSSIILGLAERHSRSRDRRGSLLPASLLLGLAQDLIDQVLAQAKPTRNESVQVRAHKIDQPAALCGEQEASDAQRL
jgi:hypothetical protein